MNSLPTTFCKLIYIMIGGVGSVVQVCHSYAKVSEFVEGITSRKIIFKVPPGGFLFVV